MITPNDLFNLDDEEGTLHKKIFENSRYVWSAISKISEYIIDYIGPIDERNPHVLKNKLKKIDFKQIFRGMNSSIHDDSIIEGPILIKENSHIYPMAYIGKNVFIGNNCKIFPGSFIGDNVIIGDFVEIRPGAYIRNNVIIGNDVTIGNSTELKNSLLFNKVEVPHFNYVGDSILGYKSHLGAGVILSNLKVNKKNIYIKFQGESLNTGRKKLGAIIGDFVEIGCNSVLNPGTIVGKSTMVYPNVSLRGIINPNSIVKLKQNIEISNID